MKPSMTVDQETGAVHLRVSEGAIAETIEAHPFVMIDVDSRGAVVGIEYLPKDVPRPETEYQFATPEDKARWEDTKRFLDDGWEGPSGDFSKTDLIDASKVDLGTWKLETKK